MNKKKAKEKLFQLLRENIEVLDICERCERSATWGFKKTTSVKTLENFIDKIYQRKRRKK